MAKEDKSFIDNWRTNFPNPIRTTRVTGDSDYASQFIGEADLLTYQTRNRMKLGKLNQLRASRRFVDGTEIEVTSIFGHDIVNISVPKPEEEINYCCIDPTTLPLSIGYTTLVMDCDQSQVLTAIGGCEPYSWSLTSGGGTLVNNGDGTATYTSPSINPDCVYNPTITLTDDCGTEATIKLAISCYGYFIAGNVWKWELIQESYCCCILWVEDEYVGHWEPTCKFLISYKSIYCDGTIDENWNPSHYYQMLNRCSPASSPTDGWCDTRGFINPTPCPDSYCAVGCIYPDPTCAWATGTYEQKYIEVAGCKYHNGVCDTRTLEQKEGACCPINPITGLPF